MPKSLLRSMVMVSCAALLVSCGDDSADGAPLEVRDVVYTTFYPSTWMAERLCGEHVEVICPLPDDADPIFWRPSKEVVREYQSARLIVVNGASFEKWVETSSLPPSRVVDLSRSFRDRFLTFKTTSHSHGPKGGHTHEGIDGHTWLAPALMKQQAEILAAALASAFPAHAASIRTNLVSLSRELDALAARLDAVDVAGAKLLASHPAYDYLARAHGWTITSLDLDPDAELGDEEVAAVRGVASRAARAILLWEASPGDETVERLEAALGVDSVVFSPCETLDPALGADYLAVMNGNIDRLEAALAD